MKEAELYAPVKRFLERQGYRVKGEIGSCDVVAVGPDGSHLIVELKIRFSLDLVLQGVERLALGENVWLAIPAGTSSWRRRRRSVIALLRRIGLGLLTVNARGEVRAVLEPGPYRPRGSATRRTRLLREFEHRTGDPETGGSAAGPRETAWRQDALRILGLLGEQGDLELSEIRERTGVARAGRILQRDPLAWFERVQRGRYRLSSGGRAALETWAEALATLP